MPPALALPLWLMLGGLLLLAAGLLSVRRSGARPAMARRLAGAREVRVGELLDLEPGDPLPPRPVRVTGRIRCAEPIVTRDGDRLVAFHRDVQVMPVRGGWRSVERLRETRSFELWDHDGSLPIDPASAADPLIVLPHVWDGSPDELDESYAAALSRVTAEEGTLRGARATTRMLSVIDRILVLASVRRDENGAVALIPPRGGYIISSLELDDAMRLLGGPRSRMMLGGTVLVAIAFALLGTAAILAAWALVVG